MRPARNAHDIGVVRSLRLALWGWGAVAAVPAGRQRDARRGRRRVSAADRGGAIFEGRGGICACSGGARLGVGEGGAVARVGPEAVGRVARDGVVVDPIAAHGGEGVRSTVIAGESGSVVRVGAQAVGGLAGGVVAVKPTASVHRLDRT